MSDITVGRVHGPIVDYDDGHSDNSVDEYDQALQFFKTWPKANMHVFVTNRLYMKSSLGWNHIQSLHLSSALLMARSLGALQAGLLEIMKSPKNPGVLIPADLQ